MLDIAAEYAGGFTPRDTREIDQWARSNIKIGAWSPWEGDFSTDQTPQIVEPLRVLGRPGPRRVTLRGPAAGGKSTVGEVFLSWAIDNSPGFAVWYAQDEDAAKEFAETRVQRFLDSCEAVRKWFPSGANRHQKRTQAINFPHMSFVIQAANQGNAQSKHIRHLIMDEPWLYAPGMMAQLRKRTTRFAHNRTILEMSTGSYEGDEFDQAWQQGSRQEWQVYCPACEQHHVPKWTFGVNTPGGVNWSKEAKRADGTWDVRRVVETTVYQCPKCSAEFKATAANGYALNSRGKYTEPAEDAMPSHWSFHWNCICSDFAQLGEIAVEYLQAKAAQNRGTSVLLQEFNQKKLAAAWAEEPPEIAIAQIDSGYNMGDPWPEEVGRMMSVDVQKSSFYVVIRSFANGGASRLVTCAQLHSGWGEVRDFQLSNAVNDDCVMIDSGFEADGVYAMCCLYGWNAIKGEKVPGGYRQKTAEGREIVALAKVSLDAYGELMPYSPSQLLPGSTRRGCFLTLVSDELTSEVMARARAGKVDGFTLARDTPRFYRDQFASMQRKPKEHPVTKQIVWNWVEIGKHGNHLWDCERYILAAMFLAGFFQFTEGDKLAA